ncbi:hypothetical protein Taro_055408 [Colocasia esculenta]|uniref:Uncharacterized protein n=1 Tax=Colocasia esculenta TaxID=4460 RepID=A0A843XU55_COLES|nr:hypothetical protein [Colocasia esculenta]
MSFRTFWGRVEKFLVAGEKEIIHTKPFFIPVVSAAICTDHLLEVDQRELYEVGVNRCMRRVFWLHLTMCFVLEGPLVSTLLEGRVENFLVAGEKEIIHTKPFFFPVVFAVICTDHILEVDQRSERFAS